MSTVQISEMSKTYQYRKVMKPMLERKRRARINKCLDELKDLMVATLESEGEHVTRLEKADILELTVTHLQKLKQQRKLAALNGSNGNGMTQAEGFRSGYIHAVNEVSRSLSELPGVNVNLGTQLMTHLGQRLNQLQPPVRHAVPITTPLSVHINTNGRVGHYSVPISPVSSYTGSPNSISSHQSLLTTCTPPTTDIPIDVVANDDDDDERHVEADIDSEENVWRPW